MLAESHNWWILIPAGMLALVGVVKLMQTGMVFLFWAFLVVAGAGGLHYGWTHGEFDPARLVSMQTWTDGLRALSKWDLNAWLEQARDLQQHWNETSPRTPPAGRSDAPPPPVPQPAPALEPVQPRLPAVPETPITSAPTPVLPVPGGRFR